MYVLWYIYIYYMGCVYIHVYIHIYILWCIYIYGIHTTTYHIIYIYIYTGYIPYIYSIRDTYHPYIYIHIYMVDTYPLAQLKIPKKNGGWSQKILEVNHVHWIATFDYQRVSKTTMLRCVYFGDGYYPKLWPWNKQEALVPRSKAEGSPLNRQGKGSDFMGF